MTSYLPRTPQARGVKCNLCKKILAQATWLDQTKLAKTTEEAQQVLDLIDNHKSTNCPCIPRNIETLLVGSTHFEIHRLLLKNLDSQIHKRQQDRLTEEHLKSCNEAKRQNHPINDCQDNHKRSKFKIYAGYNDQNKCDIPNLMLSQLCKAIDAWKMAMEDQIDPFNSKLALRLGLTHHVIYACYQFKYHKLLNYQLIAANLLVNLFKSIEGVTLNALVHSYFLLIRSLMDCNQLQLAKQYLKIAISIPNSVDKTHYESILLACVECELNLMIKGDQRARTKLHDLAKLAVIQKDDKLQHYYSRTLAMSVVIRYIHLYDTRSDLCMEFFHTFRYICAIIRRCHESSFELLMMDVAQRNKQQEAATNRTPINHSWIKFAVSDFVFSTFDVLINFYVRAGIPEYLELLYNGLNLIAYKSCTYYWQFRMAAIGIRLDVLCDKYGQANTKLDAMSRIIGHTNDPQLMNYLRLELDYCSLFIQFNERPDCIIGEELAHDLIQRLRSFHYEYSKRLSNLELFDCKSRASSKFHSIDEIKGNDFMLDNPSRHFSLLVLLLTVNIVIQKSGLGRVRQLMGKLGHQLSSDTFKAIEYYDQQIILDMMVSAAWLTNSAQRLLESLSLSPIVLSTSNSARGTSSIEMQMSSLQISTSCADSGDNNLAGLEIIEVLKKFNTLNQEDLARCYLLYSAPNPDYLKYRQAHELMFSFRLRDKLIDHSQLLYHFCESTTSNSMRYRWMMFDEQQASPYDNSNGKSCDAIHKKNYMINRRLTFDRTLEDTQEQVKWMTECIPATTQVLQVKYIGEVEQEHLVMVSFDSLLSNNPIYVHATRPIQSDEFFDSDDKMPVNQDHLKEPTTSMRHQLPSKMSSKIEAARKSLLITGQRVRTEKRHAIENDLGLLLYDIEQELLGPFRWLFCGKTMDSKYAKFVTKTCKDIEKGLRPNTCVSPSALILLVENAGLLSRDEFCKVLGLLFRRDQASDEIRSAYANSWLKAFEKFVAQTEGLESNKTSYLQSLKKCQLCLILDQSLESVPFESLPIVSVQGQPIHRMPSLRLLSILASSMNQFNLNSLDNTSVAYVLDPASNLAKTRERFESKLKARAQWAGVIGEPPKPHELESWLSNKHLYLFIGHGAGMTYYNSLCKNRGLGAMARVNSSSIIMGCSSGRVQSQGPRLESFGVNWTFISRGCPTYLGLLWDVTDTDIDRFLDSLLVRLLGSNDTNQDHDGVSLAITDATAKARLVCQMKFLVGSTPVVYGLPVAFSR